ncbi:MAG: hypothetical protein M3397_07405 [Actinomycetota bacterium]|jgi:hypothetical protein|nr:hypothetical protein [Actinomycetota bacterium]
MSIGDVAADFGKGLFAGLAGTAAMTVSSTLEMKLSGRAASETPAQAAEKVLKVEPEDAQSEGQFSNLVHWGYGTGWGGARGLLASAGLSGPVATVAHLGLVWSSEQAVLPALGVSAPVFKYGGKAVATDLLHHAVYATATGLAYSYLDRSQS